MIWPELSGLIFNFFDDKASDWGIMSRHYYFTNSLPKLLVGTALPLAIGGGIWSASSVGFVGKWARGVGRNVGEVVWTFGPGVLGLIGGMSLIGHKVSCDKPQSCCDHTAHTLTSAGMAVHRILCSDPSVDSIYHGCCFVSRCLLMIE